MSQMVPSCGKRARNAYHGCSCADRRSRRSRPSRPVEGLMRKSGCTWFAVAAAWAILALAPVAEAATVAVRGVVQDGSKQPVAGAAVYLVPAADVAKLAKPPSIEIRKDVPNDEPLEDSLAANRDRSEEHTSELQSQSNLVCRLLLEKKKHLN